MRTVLSTSLLGLVVIFVASFGDEVASVTFSFAKVNALSMTGVSVLMSCTLLGALTAGPVAMIALQRFRPHGILQTIFLMASGIVFASAYFAQTVIVYVVAFLLGGIGAIFWSVVSVMIPERFAADSLTDANKVIHAIRNAGYIVGPVVAGLLSAGVGVPVALVSVGALFLLAAPCTRVVLSDRFGETCAGQSADRTDGDQRVTTRWAQIRAFFRLHRMTLTLVPLMVTIATTSTFNVAFIHILLVEHQYSEATYGCIVAALSVGLVLGPLVLASRIERWGTAVGACASASVIGACVVLAALYQHPVWLFMVLLVLGLANGVQNTLMATFVMTIVPEAQRKMMMPLYIWIVQASVLVGFVVGGQVPIHYAQQLLLISGGLATLTGTLGAVGNGLADRARPCGTSVMAKVP